MRCNLGYWDRIIRCILAMGLLTFVFAGGPHWMYLGLYPLLTAAWGLDPLYSLWGIRTHRHGSTPSPKLQSPIDPLPPHNRRNP